MLSRNELDQQWIHISNNDELQIHNSSHHFIITCVRHLRGKIPLFRVCVRWWLVHLQSLSNTHIVAHDKRSNICSLVCWTEWWWIAKRVCFNKLETRKTQQSGSMSRSTVQQWHRFQVYLLDMTLIPIPYTLKTSNGNFLYKTTFHKGSLAAFLQLSLNP